MNWQQQPSTEQSGVLRLPKGIIVGGRQVTTRLAYQDSRYRVRAEDGDDSAEQPIRVGEDFHHITILRSEVTESLLEPRPSVAWQTDDGAARRPLILDGTLGGGGHSEALLEQGACVVGVDQDTDALGAATERLSQFGDRFLAMHGNFRNFGEVLSETDVRLDGVVLDLGVSSWQLDAPNRGFSFRHDAPLDLRMDRGTGTPASEFLNKATAEEIAEVLWRFGDEKAARRIARAIVELRAEAPIETTLQLAGLVEKVSPANPRKRKIHPATKTFQALRIHTNDELGALEDALEWIPQYLRPGGRVAVLAFHSLEDRLVKRWVRKLSQQWIDRPEWPERRPNPDHVFHAVSRKAIVPSAEEVTANPRSRSTKLRIAERIATDGN